MIPYTEGLVALTFARDIILIKLLSWWSNCERCWCWGLAIFIFYLWNQTKCPGNAGHEQNVATIVVALFPCLSTHLLMLFSAMRSRKFIIKMVLASQYLLPTTLAKVIESPMLRDSITLINISGGTLAIFIFKQEVNAWRVMFPWQRGYHIYIPRATQSE